MGSSYITVLHILDDKLGDHVKPLERLAFQASAIQRVAIIRSKNEQ